jgi:hypothetical protein
MPAIECAKIQCDIMPAFFSKNVRETEALLSTVIWLGIFQYFKIPYGTVWYCSCYIPPSRLFPSLTYTTS